jgi:hypothetical protein
MSPKQSAASQPEFFVDRSLGPETAGVLRRFGWIVHLINDFFPNDAQETADEDWISYGLQRGWGLLSKDKKIRYRADELLALSEHGKLFCLSSGNLLAREQAETFERARKRIERALQRHGARLYLVYDKGEIEKRWPPPHRQGHSSGHAGD